MKRNLIGILGGTFDPIHLGHIHLAKEIYKQCALEKILMTPCYQSPLKPSTIAKPQDRMNMVKLAIEDLPYIVTENHEISHNCPSYTLNTLKHISKKHKTANMAIIMSLDAFNLFDKWYKWQDILDLAHLIITNRHNHKLNTSKQLTEVISKTEVFTPEELQKKQFGLIYFADIKPMPITATEIRRLAKEQKDFRYLVSPKVWNYINENKIYTN